MFRSLWLLIPFCCLGSMIFWSCSPKNRPNVQELHAQFRELQQKGRDLYCELEKLGMESRILWDSVAYQLEKSIPAEVPEEERQNMIAVRNAGLIRMFEAYPKLPPATQSNLEQAEQQDQEIAARMRRLNENIRKHDHQITSFLGSVQKNGIDSLRSWKKQMIDYKCD